MKDYKNLINKLNNKDISDFAVSRRGGVVSRQQRSPVDDTASVDSQNLDATVQSLYKDISEQKDVSNFADNKKIPKKNIPKMNY